MSSSVQSDTNECFGIGTYNVWFGSDGRGAPYPEARMKAIVQALMQERRNTHLVAIGFQEVIPTTSAMLESELTRNGYLLLKQPTNSYGCALAVLVSDDGPANASQLMDSGWKSYPGTAMGRGFLWAHLKLPNMQEILVTTTHLESPVDAGGITNRREREVQIQLLESFCNEQLQKRPTLAASIITGDCNWHDQVSGAADLISSLHQPDAWTDAWLATHHANGNDDPGYTFDCIRNSLLTGERQSRLDRILICSQKDEIVPVDSFLVGQDAIPDLFTQDAEHHAWTATSTDGFSTPTRTVRPRPVFPSDHFGVVAHLQTCDTSKSPE